MRGHWDFQFCGLDHFLHWFFSFCTLVFLVSLLVPIAVCGLLFWAKIISGFSICFSMWLGVFQVSLRKIKMCLLTTSTTCTSSLIFLVVFTKIYFSFVVFYHYLYSFVVSNVLQCHPLISKKAQRWYHNQRQTITLTSLLCRCNSLQRLSSLCLARLALLNSDCKWSLSFPTCQSQKKKHCHFTISP